MKLIVLNFKNAIIIHVTSIYKLTKIYKHFYTKVNHIPISKITQTSLYTLLQIPKMMRFLS